MIRKKKLQPAEVRLSRMMCEGIDLVRHRAIRDRLWPENKPADPTKQVQIYIHHIRKAMRPYGIDVRTRCRLGYGIDLNHQAAARAAIDEMTRNDERALRCAKCGHVMSATPGHLAGEVSP